ncbi:sodium:solute symporter family transporter [Spirosoma utsteinense]|uniref:SSS family solute:Na+ symporter n=1 Tax=Spirosoma utsteinense TaxID=2585773 RepID=A0ABR6W338_9BACT|nr:sodium/solute symporter [Spirosoma utsteinense]MBC3786639.1 SSS family solute:Na+ symporter [Spirosoma utsteinense]MBC3791002.1 SSS family solute:Na+ symporter [Spirosoma utsteinense]
MNQLNTTDYIIFILYFIGVSSYGYWIYKRKQTTSLETKDFFLAEGSLTWWAIGASMIASNISAEQFIGMSGNGFTFGIAVAVYEWFAALALIIVAVWFMPIYLKNHIYTMPQFLKTRYNETVSLIMAIFWLFLYVFVNLTSILFLGALAISTLVGADSFHPIVIGLSIFAIFITLGGMKVIGYTDVIQVAVLIIGGLVTSYIALTLVSQKFGLGNDVISGFSAMMADADDHFHMIFEKPGPNTSQVDINKYLTLPGLAMYFAGIWIVNLNYWGCNQYITQRALGADLKTARTGILFAALLKIFMPLIVMLPGIAAYVLYKNGSLQNEMAPGGKLLADNAYSAILSFLPNGLKGLSMAALTAAIVASLAGKANSISTIFTLDIYQKYIKKDATQKQLVWVGRVTIFAAMLLSIALTWQDALGIGQEGGFTFIQKYTGYLSPAIFAVFILGFFWKRTTGAAAVAGILGGFALAVLFNNYAPALFGNETILYTAYPNGNGGFEIPFLICMGWSFVFTILLMVAISLTGPVINPKAFAIDASMFKLQPAATALTVIILLLVTVLYVRFW